MLKIIFLYTSVNGFLISTFKALLETGKVKSITLIYKQNNATDGNNFKIEFNSLISLIPRHTISDSDIFNLLIHQKPEIVYVPGWMDKGYIKAVSKYKKNNTATKIVCGIDDQWRYTLRQYFGKIYFKFFYRKIFDFMWVSGKPQYHYAQRFGYEDRYIISNLLSADTSLFNYVSRVSRRFVFLGRFVPVKGIELLIQAYLGLPDLIKESWKLVLIGDGSLREKIEKYKSRQIQVLPYMQDFELKNELDFGGIACVPSIRDQWGVVIHEFALLGYPLIVSSTCGAASEFLINGYNGFIFEAENVISLRKALLKIALMTNEELNTFSVNSRSLGLRITPLQSAYSLLSVHDS
jgi:glycosyltransferase involved in cell wall biosynthesis